MSKSRNNGVDPNGLVQKYGADTARLFMMFTAPPRAVARMVGRRRAGRAPVPATPVESGARARLVGRAGCATAADRDLRRLAHQTLQKVKDDIGRRRVFNTAIAQVMELLNGLGRHTGGRAVRQEALEIAVLCLAPIVPHVTHALWRELGHAAPLYAQPWREADPTALTQDVVEVVVQINGKLRGRISVAPDADEAACVAIALGDPQVQRFIEGRPLRKQIYVRGKLLNLVV